MIISPDQQLLTPEGKYLWSVPRVELAWNICRSKWEMELRTGKYKKAVLLAGLPGSGKSTWLEQNQEEGVLYFDACFKRALNRRPLLNSARREGVPVQVVWLDTPLDICTSRNALRSPERRVPDSAMADMASWFSKEPPNPKLEGFDLIRVPYREVELCEGCSCGECS